MGKRTSKQKSKGIGEKIFFAVLFCFLLLYVISLIFTLSWGVLTSFKSVVDFEIKKNVLGLPNPQYSADELKFGNYSELLNAFNFTVTNPFYRGSKLIIHSTQVTLLTTLMNTLMFTTIPALEGAVLPAIAAYLCVRFPYKFSKFLYAFLLTLMIIPIVGTYPTEIAMLRSLGMYDTMWGFFIQNFHFTGLYYFIFYAYFESMSNSYSEAAEIDGASQYRILFQIALPLAGKLILTVWLLKFVALWNNYSTILLYMPTQPTLAYIIYRSYIATTNGEHSVGEITAGCTVLAIPLVILFIVARDRLMGNLSLGGEKG